MNGEGGGLAGGLLLIVVGVFVVARTVIHDSTGSNLVDRLLAIAGGGSSSTSGGSSTVGITTKGAGVSIKHLDGVPFPQVNLPHLTLFGHKMPNLTDQLNAPANLLGAK